MPHQASSTQFKWSPSWWLHEQGADDALRWAAKITMQNRHLQSDQKIYPSKSEAQLRGPYGLFLRDNFESLDFDKQGVYCYLSKPDPVNLAPDISHPSFSEPKFSRLVPAKFQVDALVVGN